MSYKSYKNVVSVQNVVGITHAYATSGLTLATGFGTTPASIVKHSGFQLVPNGAAMTVWPTYYGPDGNGIAGVTLTAADIGPLQQIIPLRMKSYTGLTGGSINFVS